MQVDEAAVVKAFADWLQANGWAVQFEVDWQDIVAERDGQHLHVEAKGYSSSPGLDVDTAFGQLLRRMPAREDPADHYALVIPDEPRTVDAAQRVAGRVRELLRVTLYAVASDGGVRVLDVEP